MPDDDDHRRRKWPKTILTNLNLFKGAKNFSLTKPEINAVGRNAHFVQQHFNARGDQTIIFAGSNAGYVEQAEATEHERRRTPVAQGSRESRDKAAQTPPVQEPPKRLQTNKILPSAPDNAYESEATAIYAVPEVPSDTMTTYSQTSRSRLHIYHIEMLTHRAGYPLYIPTPPDGLPPSHRESGITVGDVGVITANGAFHYLFNVFRDSPSSAENNDNFELLKPKILTSKKFGPKTFLSSSCVNDTGDSLYPTFQCLSDEGALLALPKGATVYDAGNRADFQTHASRHAMEWYEYALNDGVDICNGSLYFVTECTKSMDWGIAVFYAPSTTNHNLRFSFDGESYQWDYRGKVEARTGSKSTDITSGEPNQCVFLSGFKIMLRPDIWDKLKSATTVKSPDGERSSLQTSTPKYSTNHGTSGSKTDSFHQSTSDNRNTPDHRHRRLQANQLRHTQVLQGVPEKTAETTSELGQLILEKYFGEIVPLHPSNLINVMLLQLKPEANVAITHDSEWRQHLPRDFNADPITLNFVGLLENIERSYTAVIDENGSAVLENRLGPQVQRGVPSPTSIRTSPQTSTQTSTPPITSSRPIKDSHSQISRSSVPPAETLVPTTDEDYPRFRILVVGQSDVEKSSLINAIFKAPLTEGKPYKAGAADINNGITPPHNKHLILHDSEGYEPGKEDKFRILEKFITEQTQKQSPTERLHAIWFCIPASYSGDPLFGKTEKKILELNRNKVPIIIVVTKFDLYVADMERRAGKKKKISYRSAEDNFKKEFGRTLDKNSIKEGQIPYALVSKTQVDTLQQLVKITGESIRSKTPSPSSGHSRRGSDELDPSCPAQIALATAQRVDMVGKIEASTKIGKKKYWMAIGTGIHFLDMSLEKCLKAIHKDIVTIWNIPSWDLQLHDYFLGDEFRHKMVAIVTDLKDVANTMSTKATATSTKAGPSTLQSSSVFKEGPDDMRFFMGYVVDLTLILQCIFKVSLEDKLEGMVKQNSINEIINEFRRTEKKKRAHDAIRKFIKAQYPCTRSDLEKEIASVISREKCTHGSD